MLCWFSVGHASYCGTMNVNEKVTQKDLHTINGPLCKYTFTLRSHSLIHTTKKTYRYMLYDSEWIRLDATRH